MESNNVKPLPRSPVEKDITTSPTPLMSIQPPLGTFIPQQGMPRPPPSFILPNNNGQHQQQQQQQQQPMLVKTADGRTVQMIPVNAFRPMMPMHLNPMQQQQQQQLYPMQPLPPGVRPPPPPHPPPQFRMYGNPGQNQHQQWIPAPNGSPYLVPIGSVTATTTTMTTTTTMSSSSTTASPELMNKPTQPTLTMHPLQIPPPPPPPPRFQQFRHQESTSPVPSLPSSIPPTPPPKSATPMQVVTSTNVESNGNGLMLPSIPQLSPISFEQQGDKDDMDMQDRQRLQPTPPLDFEDPSASSSIPFLRNPIQDMEQQFASITPQSINSPPTKAAEYDNSHQQDQTVMTTTNEEDGDEVIRKLREGLQKLDAELNGFDLDASIPSTMTSDSFSSSSISLVSPITNKSYFQEPEQIQQVTEMIQKAPTPIEKSSELELPNIESLDLDDELKLLQETMKRIGMSTAATAVVASSMHEDHPATPSSERVSDGVVHSASAKTVIIDEYEHATTDASRASLDTATDSISDNQLVDAKDEAKELDLLGSVVPATVVMDDEVLTLNNETALESERKSSLAEAVSLIENELSSSFPDSLTKELTNLQQESQEPAPESVAARFMNQTSKVPVRRDSRQFTDMDFNNNGASTSNSDSMLMGADNAYMLNTMALAQGQQFLVQQPTPIQQQPEQYQQYQPQPVQLQPISTTPPPQPAALANFEHNHRLSAVLSPEDVERRRSMLLDSPVMAPARLPYRSVTPPPLLGASASMPYIHHAKSYSTSSLGNNYRNSFIDSREGSVRSSSSGENNNNGNNNSGTLRPSFSKHGEHNQHLKPGTGASLLSYQQTLEMYRQNAKKTDNMSVQFEFAKYLIDVANELDDPRTKESLLDEGFKWLKKLSMTGYPEAQFYLANCYASDRAHDKAFPLYVLASKHSHIPACYEAATCYENGRGTKKDNPRAVQFYRKAASSGHKAAMYRMGTALLYGQLGLKKDIKDSLKWLKRAAAVADRDHPEALYELAMLYERGNPPVVHADLNYAGSLFVEAAELGHAPSQFKLGLAYEYGKLNFPANPQESIRWFHEAAENGDAESQFCLAGWYLTGAEGILEQSDAMAFTWALRAAEGALPKAEFAVGYFFEQGVGTGQNSEEANKWYFAAAQHGEKRAIARLRGENVDDESSKMGMMEFMHHDNGQNVKNLKRRSLVEKGDCSIM